MPGRRRLTRAELLERVLTDLSRQRPLADVDSMALEAAILDQVEPRVDRRGRRLPRNYFGGFKRLPAAEQASI